MFLSSSTTAAGGNDPALLFIKSATTWRSNCRKAGSPSSVMMLPDGDRASVISSSVSWNSR